MVPQTAKPASARPLNRLLNVALGKIDLRPNSAVLDADKAVSIPGELMGSKTCEAPARDAAPALVLCRKLIEAGVDPKRSLHAYRGDTLCLTVRSIDAGAQWTVKETPFGPRLERWMPFSTPPVASPVRASPPLRHKTGATR
jgi:hypothetical protein